MQKRSIMGTDSATIGVRDPAHRRPDLNPATFTDLADALQRFDVTVCQFLLNKCLDFIEAVLDGEMRINAIFFSGQVDFLDVVVDPADRSVELSGILDIQLESMSFGGLVDRLHNRLRGLNRNDLKAC